MGDTVSPAELRTLFLFETLDADKLGWLAAHGREVRIAAGDPIYAEGEPATCFFVLLDGTIAMSRQVRGSEIEVNRTDRRGVYAGDIGALLTDEPSAYTNSLRAVTDCRMFEIPIADFGVKLRDWSPLHMHLLNGVFGGVTNSQRQVSERERLIALGALTAGLTHELNNPAAAAGRAVDALHKRIAAKREHFVDLSAADLLPGQLTALAEASREADGRPAATPLEISDREDELADWLDERGLPDPADLAAAFVAVGLDVAWAQRVAESIPESSLPTAMTWLATNMEIDGLLSEVDDAMHRITSLLDSARQYAQMDRAPGTRVDVHDLLDATLTMLRHKIPDGVDVITEYDRSLPKIEVYGAELNQVWTNLIVNALDAMGASGRLTIRTALDDGEHLLVEIVDTGPGIPPETQSRIFEPFFSTKPVGKGTGLGLDISWRIIVKKHRGDLRVQSRPGDTRVQVRLPLTA